MFNKLQSYREEIEESHRQTSTNHRFKPIPPIHSNSPTMMSPSFNPSSTSSFRCPNPRNGCECTTQFANHLMTDQHHYNNYNNNSRVPQFSSYSVRCPTPPPIIERYVERAVTPEPDIIEKILVKPQPQKYIERIIEKPRVPPPIIKCKVEFEPPKPPIYKTR